MDIEANLGGSYYSGTILKIKISHPFELFIAIRKELIFQFQTATPLPPTVHFSDDPYQPVQRNTFKDKIAQIEPFFSTSGQCLKIADKALLPKKYSEQLPPPSYPWHIATLDQFVTMTKRCSLCSRIGPLSCSLQDGKEATGCSRAGTLSMNVTQ